MFNRTANDGVSDDAPLILKGRTMAEKTSERTEETATKNAPQSWLKKMIEPARKARAKFIEAGSEGEAAKVLDIINQITALSEAK